MTVEITRYSLKRFTGGIVIGSLDINQGVVEQKLNYIHENASRGEVRLVDNPEDYEHSSARYYKWLRKGEYLLEPIWSCNILI
ncbi:hypothetical protein WG906_13950 [Pedobacter sp. P351]|uniref:hypothetical protein n=1 Tax=Pedobacter superstes TaxID=3133441 RepID=UPI0030B1278F